MSDRTFIAQAPGSRFGDRVFLCKEGKRYLVPDASRLAAYEINWPGDLRIVDAARLEALRPAQVLPFVWSEADRKAPPAGLASREMREISAAGLTGFGLEIGALASPYPVPVNCSTIFGDIYDHSEMVAKYRHEQNVDDIVIPVIKTEFETLEGSHDGSLDYLVASHVIEHTRDPIGAIVNAHRKLREGGRIILVIPDKRRTFDKDRPLTELSHLVEDFHNPSHERDGPHHEEFFRLAFPDSYSETTWRSSWKKRLPIHYHTWVYETFGPMIDWIRANAAPYSSVWSHPTPDGEFEFYFALTK